MYPALGKRLRPGGVGIVYPALGKSWRGSLKNLRSEIVFSVWSFCGIASYTSLIVRSKNSIRPDVAADINAFCRCMGSRVWCGCFFMSCPWLEVGVLTASGVAAMAYRFPPET